jgi:NDP-sugar pyrophosphorylase family protein
MEIKKIKHALVMAAGRGMRMMPLTDIIPKAMAPFSGTTLIAEGVSRLKKHIENIHITVGYKGAMLASHVLEHDVSSVFNTEGKGNSWWLYNTLIKYINEPIFVLTCDNVVELDFEKYAADYLDQNSPACLLIPVKPVAEIEGDYIFHDGNNIVTEINRKKKSDIYCSGIQILNPSKVNQLTKKTEDFYQVWAQLIEQEQLCVSGEMPEEWYAVDDLIQLKAVNKQNGNGSL